MTTLKLRVKKDIKVDGRHLLPAGTLVKGRTHAADPFEEMLRQSATLGVVFVDIEGHGFADGTLEYSEKEDAQGLSLHTYYDVLEGDLDG